MSIVPHLYPDLDSPAFEQFLSDNAYQRIKRLENVYILPFISRNGTSPKMCFGFGLSRAIMRNLMLLNGTSIHGPEDTPESPDCTVREMARLQPRSCFVAGLVGYRDDGFTLEVEAHRAGQAPQVAEIRQRDFHKFIRKCSSKIARLLGCPIDEETRARWEVGQPRSPKTLLRLGKIHEEFNRNQTIARAESARDLLEYDPDFAVAAWDIDEELPGARKQFFKALELDPYNAQLYFQSFCTLWKSKGPQPEALQFCRKAIEVSPGHGKAHMCAPHAARNPVAMLRHSELGYRLLPGNSFAVNNYTLALKRANAPASQRIELALEGIASDPKHPGNYRLLIELYELISDHRSALKIAEQLQKLYEPRMDERTLYCLRQNPQMAKLIDSGSFDPAAENRQRIAELRNIVEKESA